VLTYMVTSNQVHLLVKDAGGQVIAQSMQLIAGRTAREYNQRKGRQGRVLGRPLPCYGNRGP
jgi:putative transposase